MQVTPRNWAVLQHLKRPNMDLASFISNITRMGLNHIAPRTSTEVGPNALINTGQTILSGPGEPASLDAEKTILIQ